MQFHSPALSKACSMNIILPDAQPQAGPYPVLYLLHGLSDDHTIWTRRTSIERYVGGLPLIVVMPDGGRSFYCDGVAGPAYETHIVKDVVGFVDRFFDTRKDRAGRAIGGLSMGGYGALKLGLKFLDLFCSAVSHSGALGITQGKSTSLRADAYHQIFGPSPAEGKDCLFGLAKRVDRSRLPAIRIDCGVDDGLLEANREYHALLTDLGIAHEYEEFPGAHDWGYWDVHVQEAIGFHRKALGI